MNDFAKEIGLMNDVLGDGQEDVSTETPSTESPGTEAPSTEAPTTDIPEDDLSTDAPGTDAPTTEIPDWVASIIQENEQLKAERNKAPKTSAPSTSAPTTEAPFTNEDFLGDADIDEVLGDPEKFNQLLNSVLKKGMEMAKGITIQGNETVLKSIPDIVKSNISLVTNLKKASDDFYDSNPDLKPWKQAVASVFEEIASKNPDKTIQQNLETVGEEVRKRLKFQKTAVDKNKDNNKPPKLPGNKGNKRGSNQPETKGIAAEIEAMNKSIQ
jgi:hypothetical protein